MAEIKLIGPEIKGYVNKTVRLEAEFAGPCWSCIHERRAKHGYVRLDDQHGGSRHVYDAMVHEDTTHFVVSIGDEGRPDLEMTNNIGQIWCPVSLTTDPSPTGEGSQGEDDLHPQSGEDAADLGTYKYSILLLTDNHLAKDTDEWGDEKDFRRCMDLAVEDPNIKCVMGCGDLIESGSPKNATPEDDAKDFLELYDVPYWQVAGLRLFSPMGNHDYYAMFESRQGDTLLPDRFTNYNSISGRNPSVLTRMGNIWLSGGGINDIVPSRGRIVFDMEAGKHTAVGQADMNFLAYNGYVEKYKDAAGYTDPLAPEENRFSDKAVAAITKYVFDHWDACRDNLSAWADGGCGMRNGYSKKSFWLKKDNAKFVHLSVDYGNDLWPVNNSWHDRMIHARTMLDLNTNDPYVRRLLEYVADTDYCAADEPYNYQYYSVNSLIWLLEIVEHSEGEMVLVFTHHFLPNRTGNGVGLPKDGNWQYAVIHPDGEKDSREGGIYNLGSNALTGITFWFFQKLLNSHRNIIMFGGHSHISMASGANFDNHDYPIVPPSERNEFVYTKASTAPLRESAWTVALSSMSKPRDIVDGQSVRRYEDAEMAVMEIYERGVKIKGYKVRENNQDVNRLLAEKEIQLL